MTAEILQNSKILLILDHCTAHLNVNTFEKYDVQVYSESLKMLMQSNFYQKLFKYL